ncbi:MAG: hypothetical protein R3240_03530 [Gammaproteobacteria bacterium]|nr:hypothetical protein [Gammaproteobacteria bacterium]
MKNTVTITLLLLTSLATIACSTPRVVDKQFGSSVKNMVKHQAYDPYTLRQPPAEQVAGQDSQKAMLDKHRIYRTSDVSKQKTKAAKASGGSDI